MLCGRVTCTPNLAGRAPEGAPSLLSSSSWVRESVQEGGGEEEGKALSQQ